MKISKLLKNVNSFKSLITTFSILLLYILNNIPLNGQAYQLKFKNLVDHQEVSGWVKIELKADSLNNFKKVSYCINNKLLQNVYHYPFTIEFDSRDHSNGEYHISVSGLSKNGPVYSNKVEVRINNQEQPYNIIIDNPRRLVTEKHSNYRHAYIDCPHTVLKKNETELYFFHSQGLLMFEREKHGLTYKSSGTLTEPLRTIISGNYMPQVWNKGNHKTQGIWLMSVYKIGENELLGFTHNESCFLKDKPCNKENKFFSIGIGYSNNNGNTWNYCGDIIRTPQYGLEGYANIKGTPYIIKDEYFYVYFWEFPSQNVWYPAVARANMKDVINSARKGKVANWSKYKNGKWLEDGMTGTAGNVMSNLDTIFNMHCKTSYLPSLEKYIMITYMNGKNNIFILLSDDGLNWKVSERIMDYNNLSDNASYPFFGDFYTDDCHELDDDFYIYWARKNRELYGAHVIIESK